MLTNKKILVTGADGFIGSHLVEMLAEAGADVRAFVYYNSFGNLGNLEDSHTLHQIETTAGDIRDPHFCRTAMQGIDIVFNLAALIAIPYSYIAPNSYLDTNVNGALNICQAARELGVRVIQMSTSEVYGTAQYTPIDEKHPLVPQSPYSASKISADMTAISFYHAFGLPVTIARAFNTYGPRQSARAFIPTVITQIAAGTKQLKLGDLSPTRDLNYVADTCRALMLLATHDAAIGETVNIGSGREHSMAEVCTLTQGIMGNRLEITRDETRLRPQNCEVLRLICDNAKLKTLTDFSPQHDLRTGLEATIKWFANDKNLAKYKTDIYNV